MYISTSRHAYSFFLLSCFDFFFGQHQVFRYKPPFELQSHSRQNRSSRDLLPPPKIELFPAFLENPGPRFPCSWAVGASEQKESKKPSVHAHCEPPIRTRSYWRRRGVRAGARRGNNGARNSGAERRNSLFSSSSLSLFKNPSFAFFISSPCAIFLSSYLLLFLCLSYFVFSSHLYLYLYIFFFYIF